MAASVNHASAGSAFLEERQQRQKRLREIVRPDDPTTWDNAWKEKITPWDMGAVQPSLKEVIEESGIAFPQTGRALVPGCGTGYDVFYLAQRGLKATGMDISETAVEAANRERSKYPKEVIDNSSFLSTDFFTFTPPNDERFDLIVDHTFFVAIPPSLRPAWGAQMSSLLKPGGLLITLVYPILQPTDTGPPYFVRPEHYDAPLAAEGHFSKIWDRKPAKSSPSHEGIEQVLVWRRN